MPYVRIRPIKVLGEGRVGRGEREREPVTRFTAIGKEDTHTSINTNCT
jgi:hypothetical protein